MVPIWYQYTNYATDLVISFIINLFLYSLNGKSLYLRLSQNSIWIAINFIKHIFNTEEKQRYVSHALMFLCSQVSK